MTRTYDAIIVGGGLVGQTLALALAAHDLTVAVVERADPDSQLAPGFDGRASAVASSSARMLRALGFGDLLEAQGCAIRAIRVSDGIEPGSGGRGGGLRFDSAEADPAEPLGIMLENRLLREALLGRVRATPGIALFAPAGMASIVRGADGAEVALVGGEVLAAPLILGCDGRQSALRDAAGIRCARWSYDGQAIVTMLAHSRPHGEVASEIFFPDGPLALLPMRDTADGRHRSALVWTVAGRDADAMLSLGPRGLADAVGQRMGGLLGTVELLAPATRHRLGLHHAERYWAERLVLVGDAAHGIHPIAGQGLNLGWRDVAALTEVLVQSARIGMDLGHPEIGRRYERWRRADNSATAFATDALARLFAVPGGAARHVRRAGLAAVARLPALRRGFMQVARGEAGDLPPLLRGEIA